MNLVVARGVRCHASHTGAPRHRKGRPITVANRAAASKVEVAVIPTDKFTSKVDTQMKAGQFKNRVICQDMK